MRDVYDYAKYYIKNGADSMPNTFDGNMKLQKLLVFTNLVNIAEHGKPLFDNQILAFKNGCVVEKIRLRYKNDYAMFKKDSEIFQPDFSEEEYETLKIVMDIFGGASARELSEINHTFDFWKIALKNGTTETGYHDKSASVVDIISQTADIERMKEIIAAYKEAAKESSVYEIINGIKFYYDDIILTDDIIEQLETFSLRAEDDTYSVYMDGGKLMIF